MVSETSALAAAWKMQKPGYEMVGTPFMTGIHRAGNEQAPRDALMEGRHICFMDQLIMPGRPSKCRGDFQCYRRDVLPVTKAAEPRPGIRRQVEKSDNHHCTITYTSARRRLLLRSEIRLHDLPLLTFDRELRQQRQMITGEMIVREAWHPLQVFLIHLP